MPVKQKISSLERLAKTLLSRLLLGALSRATEDSDLSETEETCQVLGCLDALEFIAEDVLDKLSEVLYLMTVLYMIFLIFNLEAARRDGKVEQSLSAVVK